jgi:hypothetical protein
MIGQGEGVRGGVENAVSGGGWDGMIGDIEEADLSGGGIEFGGNCAAGDDVWHSQAGDVDDRDLSHGEGSDQSVDSLS